MEKDGLVHRSIFTVQDEPIRRNLRIADPSDSRFAEGQQQQNERFQFLIDLLIKAG
jgi:hypothetical protein